MALRNCAWHADNDADKRTQPVWARKEVFTLRCPKSIITPVSLQWLGEFQVWKTFGSAHPFSMNAKSADAMAILELELRKESAREKEQ